MYNSPTFPGFTKMQLCCRKEIQTKKLQDLWKQVAFSKIICAMNLLIDVSKFSCYITQKSRIHNFFNIQHTEMHH